MIDYLHKTLTGEQFNELFSNKHFVKLTNDNCKHRDFEYKEGLNTDTIEFNPTEDCKAGGLYFTDIDNWVSYDNDIGIIYYMWDVKIPDNATVYIEENKYKATGIILTNKRCIYDSQKYCKLAFQQNGFALQFVFHQ